MSQPIQSSFAHHSSLHHITANCDDVVRKTYDILGFRPLVATLTYDITYAIAYDIVGQTYDVVCDSIRNLRYRRFLPTC